jgi:hypothetical protein
VERSLRLLGIAAATCAFGAGLAVGQATSPRSADASPNRAYTVRVGDKIAVPAVNQMCLVTTEGGSVDLLCARRRNARHQVAIFRDRILVWKVGNPDRPAWSGRP